MIHYYKLQITKPKVRISATGVKPKQEDNHFKIPENNTGKTIYYPDIVSA